MWDESDASHQGRHEEGRYRRIEVITGRRRRNWTPAEKARVVGERALGRKSWPSFRLAAADGAGAGEGGCGTKPALQFVPIRIAGEDRQVEHFGAAKHEVPTSGWSD
ncbi:hypothetical protein [Mesorhizobium sp.]|uniref:hypothetical protein n=1 Tax=Mesorhizobium sp. TaxID=1871066 RepID=UPI0025BC59A8|nr:hypothetical protein [Mesorhizobium sp.]